MSIFGRAIIREIGRNVGKGISNDLFGDWHATPVRMAGKTAAKQGYDIAYVQPEEYDVSEQPFFEEDSYLSAFFLYGFFGTITIAPIALVWFAIIRAFLKKKCNLYARIPARRKDGRTKLGYRELGTVYIKLKSKRLLTAEERKRNQIFGLVILLGHMATIGLVFYLSSLGDVTTPSE